MEAWAVRAGSGAPEITAWDQRGSVSFIILIIGIAIVLLLSLFLFIILKYWVALACETIGKIVFIRILL